MSTPAPIELPESSLPVGTQVVLKRDIQERKAGQVGEVVEAAPTPEHSYRVRFADGTTLLAKRKHLRVRRSELPDTDDSARKVSEYEPHLILRVTLGSQAYGLATAESDRDEKGIFLPPAAWHWSLNPLPEQVEFKRSSSGEISTAQQKTEGDDHCWWEIEKFLRLALRANPTILEVLFVGEEHILQATDLGRELIGMRSTFVTQHLYQTYSGYVLSQFKKMKRAGKKWKKKHAMHLIRLLHAGIHALKTGEIPVDATAHRDELLDIKHGKRKFEEVHTRAIELDREFQAAAHEATIPEQPDLAAVDAFLIRARRSVVGS